MIAASGKRMICIPGLGGHPSVFAEYLDMFPGYELKAIEFVSRKKALEEARAALAAEKEPVVLFCHCYSAQLGIQLAEEMPEKVGGLVFLEPFFVEFQPWMKILLPINLILLGLMKILDFLGLRRRKFSYQPDYVALAKYPIYFQPFFDMRWQNPTDYFDKCYDILTYKLPKSVGAPTLMIFSPQGFSRDPGTRRRLGEVFQRVRIVEVGKGTHNVITMGASSVAEAIRESLNSK
jgi:pimeloyl-ACP methyl ester carboxylesterase